MASSEQLNENQYYQQPSQEEEGQTLLSNKSENSIKASPRPINTLYQDRERSGPRRSSNTANLLVNKSMQPSSTVTQSKSPKVNQSTNSNENTTREDEKSSILIAAFIAMLFFQLGNRIFGKLQTLPMHNYPTFMNFISTVIYIPISFAYVIPVLFFSPGTITKEQRNIPKYKFAIMGAYDSIAGIMQTFAVNYISNASMIVLVQQSAIPISMVISNYFLGSVYTKAQYIGAGVVLLGIIVVLIPTMIGNDSSAQTSTESSHSELLWLLILVVSCIPMCLSSVYKEKALGETEIDIMYLNGWVAVFQFLIAIPLSLPTSMIQDIPVNEIIPNIYDGMYCWLGYDSVTADHNPNHLSLDDCSMAPFYVTAYLSFNVVYNILIILILKHGSANILWMASTVIVPLSNVAFSLKFMPGSQPLRFWDVLGLLVIMLGLIIYRFSNVVIQVYKMIRGERMEETESSKEAEKKIQLQAERKQLKYSGWNHMEYLEPVVDARILREKASLLFRSPQQIRGNYLAKVGVPPSPLISMELGNRRPTLTSERDAANGKISSSSSARMSPYSSNGSSKGILVKKQSFLEKGTKATGGGSGNGSGGLSYYGSVNNAGDNNKHNSFNRYSTATASTTTNNG